MATLLAIESSCDETAVAIADSNDGLLGSWVRSQESIHANFSGIVPEVASRCHCAFMLPMIDHALAELRLTPSDLQAIAVTNGPGLLGSLLVGLTTAKTLAYCMNLPLIVVDHIEAHIASAYINDGGDTPQRQFPHLALIVSGGHTLFCHVEGIGQIGVIGRTLDDAVGEAYDKIASFLDLGYPGGPAIDKLAEDYAGELIDFPLPMRHSKDLNLSFSGLKTAVIYYCQKHFQNGVPQTTAETAQVAASFQFAAIELLLIKLKAAIELYPGIQQIVVSGGVSCNRYLRQRLKSDEYLMSKNVLLAKPKYCTDNAAMIARVATDYFNERRFADQAIAPYSSFQNSPVLLDNVK